MHSRAGAHILVTCKAFDVHMYTLTVVFFFFSREGEQTVFGQKKTYGYL